MPLEDSLSRQEKRAGYALAAIYAVRMLGLFMILPVFTIYAETIPDSTPMLAGIALGVYGLTQGLLQIPFGMLSDKIGRKPVIVGGLLIFALGSLVAAQSDSIYGIILGRALQGSGAIAAALMALAADLSREENRLKIMSFIGVSIGFAFALSMVLGPLLNTYIGMSGLFVFTAVMALLAILVLFTLVPTPDASVFHRDTQMETTALRHVLADAQLLRLDYGIFVLHMVLMASFVAIPLTLQPQAAFDVKEHWKISLPVFLLAVALMVPFIIVAEKKRRMKQVFVGAILALLVAELVLYDAGGSLLELSFALLLFFTAFNLLEASLPSLVSKIAPADRKGTAMGIYSSSQFIGAFVGGWMGGLSYQHWGADGVFLFCGAIVLSWLLLAVTMRNPRYVSTYVLKVGSVAPQEVNLKIAELVAVRGVVEASLAADEGIAYLKVERHALDEDKLLEYSINRPR